MLMCHHFYDNTLLIKAIIDSWNVKVRVLNYSNKKSESMLMLQHFFSETVSGIKTKNLFVGTTIAKEAEYMKHQGTYPVICLDFNRLNLESSDENRLKELTKMIREICLQFKDVLTEKNITSQYDFKVFAKLLASESIKSSQLEDIISLLSKYICRARDKRPIILIEGSEGMSSYSKSLFWIVKKLFSSLLKGNDVNFEYAIIAGIPQKLDLLPNNCMFFSDGDSSYQEFFTIRNAYVKPQVS